MFRFNTKSKEITDRSRDGDIKIADKHPRVKMKPYLTG